MSPENLSWIGVRVWDRAEVKMPRVLSPPSLHTAVISARDRCSLLLFLGPKMDSVPKSTSLPIKKDNFCADSNVEKCSLLRFCGVWESRPVAPPFVVPLCSSSKVADSQRPEPKLTRQDPAFTQEVRSTAGSKSWKASASVALLFCLKLFQHQIWPFTHKILTSIFTTLCVS